MSHYDDQINNLTWTYTKYTPKEDISLEQRIAVLESNYNILETALTQLEHANQHNLKERDDAYTLLGELLVKGAIHYEVPRNLS